MNKPRDWRFVLGIGSCFLLAIVCLGVAIHQARVMDHLLSHGKRSVGAVIKIHVGAKGSKWAVIQFVDEHGQTVTSRDRFQMYVIRHQVGDPITVLYDPTDPKVATIDLGPWLWQGPAIFLGGFVFLIGLGAILSRARSRG